MRKYRDYRQHIKTGDIYFTSGGGFGNIIRFITQSHVSHCGVFFWIGDNLMVLDATTKGLEIKRASKMMDEYQNVSVGCSTRMTKTKKQITEKCFDLAGESYDFWGMLLSPFFDTKSKSNFCSESVAKILGITFPKLARGVYPLDIANTCNKFVYITK